MCINFYSCVYTVHVCEYIVDVDELWMTKSLDESASYFECIQCVEQQNGAKHILEFENIVLTSFFAQQMTHR